MPFLQILLAASGNNALGHQETLRNESYQDISPSVCRWCFSLLVSASLLGYEKGGAWVQPIPAGYRDSARSWEAWEQRGHLPIAGLRRHRGMWGVFGRRMGGAWGMKSELVSTRWCGSWGKAFLLCCHWCLYSRLKHLGGGEDTILGMCCFRQFDCKENSCY